MRFVIVTFLVVGAVFGAMKDQAPITLVATSSAQPDVSGFRFWGAAQCDQDGNLYFHSSSRFNDLVFLKISSKGSHEIYTVNGTPAASGDYFAAFRVTHDKKLWVLTGRDDDLFVLEYSDDPSAPLRTRLEAPKGYDALTVTNFVMLRNDHIQVYGILGDKVPKTEQGHSYALEFDPSLKLIRNSLASSRDAEPAENPFRGASAAEGRDGTLFLLAGKQVLVLSATGKIVRKIDLHPPEPGFEAHNLYVSDRRMVVGFAKKEPDGMHLKYRYALLDWENGEQLRLYEPGPDTGSNMVCFSDEGFTSSGSRTGT
jgi:hypothetical protein